MRNMQTIEVAPLDVPGAMPIYVDLPAPALKERSRRFPIQTLFRYRRKGTTDWNETTTVNISRTGVLFEAREKLPIDAQLEMQIVFPVRIKRGVPLNIFCWGPVVRTELSKAAAAIHQYRFRRMTS